MATDIIYCKYATGSDTVGIGDGTFEHPYKTLNKALSVHTVGKQIGLLDNQPLASAETLPTYTTTYVINSNLFDRSMLLVAISDIPLVINNFNSSST